VIILDTNVLSALMRPAIDQPIASWVNGLPEKSVWITSVTIFEIRFGLERLAVGRRRQQLEDAFDAVLGADLQNRVLDFDVPAANAAGKIAAELQRGGRSTEIRDVQIAGIASSRKATLATRNTRHFEGIKLAIVNPWSVSMAP
jgi:predicted nucleic acid-binding protein